MSKEIDIHNLDYEIDILDVAIQALGDNSKLQADISSEIDRRRAKLKKLNDELLQEFKTSEIRLSEQIKQYILRQSRTLSGISRKTGVPKTTLCGWLNGQKEITTGVLDKICHAYNITPFNRNESEATQ